MQKLLVVCMHAQSDLYAVLLGIIPFLRATTNPQKLALVFHHLPLGLRKDASLSFRVGPSFRPSVRLRRCIHQRPPTLSEHVRRLRNSPLCVEWMDWSVGLSGAQTPSVRVARCAATAALRSSTSAPGRPGGRVRAAGCGPRFDKRLPPLLPHHRGRWNKFRNWRYDEKSRGSTLSSKEAENWLPRA